jgi:alkyl sulfatase BDS1-like metallo-beta-lactamase superfamily hydrolase
MMGGASKIIRKGQELYAKGDYLLAIEILNKLVYAEPGNQEGKDLLADCFEQVGYQQESPSVRNSFLAGAYELRNGIPTGASPKTGSPDLIKAVSVGMLLDNIGIRLVPEKAAGVTFTMNLNLPDIKEQYVVELSNSTLTNIQGFQSDKADLTLNMNRADLNAIMFGQATFEQLIKEGKITFEGNIGLIAQLKEMLDTFEVGFEIMPGTLAKPSEDAVKGVFEMDEPAWKGAE